MLFSTLSMSAATQYCDVLLETADGDVKYSLYHVSGNTYGIQVVPQDGMALTNIYNSNIGVNQTGGAGITITQWTISNNIATAIFQTASETSVPTNFFTAYICFNKTGGKTGRDLVEVTIPASDIDWTTTCDASDEGGGVTSTPVLESVELFGAAQNFVLLTPTATDDKGVTSYLIAQSGGAESEVTPDATTGQIKIASLTLGTTYTYTVKAKDADGNVSNAKEITFSTLDNVFCEEEVLPGTLQEFANQKLTFTAKKVSDTETYFAITSSTSTLTKISTVTFYNNTGETGSYGGGILPDGYVLKDGWTLKDNILSKTVTWATYPTAPFRASINAIRSKNSDSEKTTINWMYTMDVSNTCGEEAEPGPDPTPDPTVTPGYSAGAGTNEGANYTYVYTNDDAGNVRLWVTFSEAVEGVAGPQFYTDGNVAIDAMTTDNKVFYTSVTGKKDGDVVKLRARIPRAGGLTQTPLLSHTVGTESGMIVTEYCNYTNAQLTKNGVAITLSWETADNGDVVITMGNGVGATSCAFRNGGFEGGIDAFVISADNFTTTTPASNYFTFEKVYSGNEARLVKLADLPKGTKIKHIGTGHALSWTVNGNGEYSFPDFIYTYGGVCNKLDAPTNVAVTDAGVVTFDLVDGADAYEVHVYQGAVLKHTQDIVSGGTISFVAYADGAYTVKVVAKGAGKGDSEESDGATWNMTAAPLPGSNYCETPADRITANNGSCSPLFTWVTTAAGNVTITLTASEGDADATKFRGTGMNGEFRLDGSADSFNAYFNREKTNDYTYTLTLQDAANKPLLGSVISYSGQIEAASSINGNDWSNYVFDGYLYGTKCDGPKRVTVSVNDAAMGTATVTQNGVAVTEVATGSEVTFTAIANEGHIFVNWSNGNTNPSFTTTVDAAMNLTANFRALGTVYCNTPMTVDGHTIYVTMKRSDPETYQLIVRSEENLTNFGRTNFYRSNNIHVIDLYNQGVFSEDKHILTATFSAETAPYMGTPLYVEFEGIGEKTYQQLTNIEYDVECEEDMTVTGLALNPATVSIVLGDAQTLKPIFTPAHAFGNELEWSSSDETIVTVDENGVVTAVAEGEAIITAKLVSNPAISATCKITVEPITVKTWWGGFKTFTVNSQEYNVLYSFTRNEDRTITYSVLFDKDASAIGVKEVNVAGVDHGLIYDNANKTASWTSTTTHSSGEVITGYFYFGIVFDFNFSYIVGSSNERPTITVESVTLDKTSCELMPNETAQLVATVNPGYVANKAVTWSSSADDVATVDANGLVTAKSAGTATITATSAADNTKTATCTINVMAELTDVTYHASTSVKKDANAYLGINYSITRTSDRTLRYVIKVNNSEYVDLEFNVVVNDNWQRMTYDASTNTYTYTTITTYADGDVVSGFFRQIKYGVEGRWDFNYEVGTTNVADPRTMVAFNDEDVDLSHLNNGSVYDVILKRNFVMDEDWNTICLPFALTEEQVVDIFGEGTTLVKLEESKLSSATEINLVFVPVTYIEASTPYLIKPVKTVDAGVALEGVVINLTPNVIETDDANMIPVLKAQSFTGENNTFYLGANENLYPRPTSREIKAMRAYFQFPNLTAAQASKLRARVVVEENVETALDNVSGQKQENIKVISNGQLIIIHDGGKYNAQGVKISE